MYDQLLRLTVGRRRTQAALSLSREYQPPIGSEEKTNFQLCRLNEAWSKALVHCPYWLDIAREYKIPGSLKELGDLERFPVLTKSAIQDNYDKIFMRTTGDVISSHYMTSGSTGEPTRYPRGSGDEPERINEVFAYRATCGILPFDRFIYFGGLPGSTARGLTGELNVLKRKSKDLIGNSRRMSGYTLGTDSALEALELICKFEPKYLVGFPSKITEIARHAKQLAGSEQYSFLQYVILSSENFTEAEAETISQTFGCRVLSEYGAEEIGVIAASNEQLFPLDVRWRYVSLRSAAASGELLVSTLGYREFPLFQYAIGDFVEPEESFDGSILSISKIYGRTREALKVGSKSSGESLEIMPLHFMNFLKVDTAVRDVQFFQPDHNSVSIYVCAGNNFNFETAARTFSAKVRDFYPEINLRNIELCEVPNVVLGARSKRKVLLEQAHENVIQRRQLGA